VSETLSGKGESKQRSFVVIGGGPAGLTAGYQLTKEGHAPTVVEKTNIVGGLARTEKYKGYHFDMGGHRFFTKSKPVFEMWQEVLAGDFLKRPRMSRIYYRKVFFDYPLKPFNALRGLGLVETLRVIASYGRWKIFPYRKVETFEQWVTNRFGKRLFEVFFKSYTEKVWGISCQELRAEWAAQRIKDLSLVKALTSMFYKPKVVVRTLIEEFHYPRRGPGMLWEKVTEIIGERGGSVVMNAHVTKVERTGNRIDAIHIQQNGESRRIAGTDFISSMPVSELAAMLDPPAEKKVLQASARLRYRDFLTVCLIVNQREVFPDNWIYVHEPSVDVARIQNYKNWSPEMVPDQEKSSLGLEYFCNEGDDLWNRPDSELIEQGKRELELTGLARAADIEDGCVFRVPRAYPVYDSEYRQYLDQIRELIDGFENLQTIGRNGLHQYNNQDHAMLTAMYAVQNAVNGDTIDLWSVNVDQEYIEEVQEEEAD
jgi:protoporphyrinogen oxidase